MNTAAESGPDTAADWVEDNAAAEGYSAAAEEHIVAVAGQVYALAVPDNLLLAAGWDALQEAVRRKKLLSAKCVQILSNRIIMSQMHKLVYFLRVAN